MRPEFEAIQQTVKYKCGQNVATPLATKRPELALLESFPSKESFHICRNQAKNLGRFLDMGVATLWPNFFLNVSIAASDSSSILRPWERALGGGLKTLWTVGWAAIWEGISREVRDTVWGSVLEAVGKQSE